MAVRRSVASTSAVKPINSWSYSRFTAYDPDSGGCPRKAKFKFIDKLKEPGSEAMDRGNVHHKFAELYVKGVTKLAHKLMVGDRGDALCTTKAFPKFLKEWEAIREAFSDEFATLKARKALTEEQAIFREDWSETVWNDWTGAWLRVKVDAHYIDKDGTVVIIDYKTGKIKDSHRGQLSLYAVAAFLRYPKAKKVRAELWYLDAGEVLDEEFVAKDLPRLQKEWLKRVKPLLTDTKWKPNPGRACTYCHFRKDNGGPCEF